MLLALSLTACGTGGARIETTEIPGGDLAARETFAWQGPRLVAQGVEASEQQVQQFDSSIQAGVVDALEAKGFRQAPVGTADFLVTYQFVVSGRSVETRRNPTPPSVSGSVGAGDPLDIMRQSQVAEEQVMRTEGSLIIFATDRETGRILWRGVADQAVVSVGRAVREIPRVVREMMQEFPARAT
ncbi:MAG TPA: DUF4136 domain-containing protein [Steroidobacteraceae bacterium]|nr:DUF4136 domain-containing protein [Steroidobacteraceae bacterium]